MKRVSMEAAKHPGSVILNNMPKFTGAPHQVTSQMMTYNRQWLLQQMRSGRPTRAATNRATGNAATAFFTKEGGYVIRDNVTRQIIQVSNRLDPKWIPDATIINPYIPK